MQQLRILSPSLGEFIEQLTIDLQAQAGSQNSVVRIAALVFAQPQIELVAKEILPSLPYFHLRSDKHINFYFAGFSPAGQQEKPEVQIDAGDGERWSFKLDKFVQACKNVSEVSSWKYSGGTDLILVNARLAEVGPAVGDRQNHPIGWTRRIGYLEFGSAVSVTLEEMRRDKAFTTVPQFFESIIQYAETQSGTDPTWGFSDAQGLKLGKSAFVSMVLSLIPQSIRSDIRKAEHFAVRDISAKHLPSRLQIDPALGTIGHH